jgi:CRISPR-associated protein (TIGR03986 family)
MTVHAPFRFAPINRWVYFPEWADLVHHDIPFKDGLSGEIELEIRAETPLLVGGPRRKPGQKGPDGREREGHVTPFRLLPDGRYAIPGSTLQGMTRQILEVASFGRLGTWVDDRRFGIRDLSEPARPYYRDILVGQDSSGEAKVKAGFLSVKDGIWSIQPCRLLRIRFSLLPGKGIDWTKPSLASERQGWLPSPGPYTTTGDPDVQSIAADPGGKAWVVVTGKTGARNNPKLREFVFVEAPTTPSIEVDDSVAEDFRYIHEHYGSEDEDDWNDAWRLYWRKGWGTQSPLCEGAGGRAPVFYVLDPDNSRVRAFGLAQMFKLPHTASTQQLLSNSHPDHKADTRCDLPTLIFGQPAEQAGLKRRVAFDLATAEQTKFARPLEEAILLSPKPSYFPAYVRQYRAASAEQLRVVGEQRRANGHSLKNYEPYATYTPLERGGDRRRDPEGVSVRQKEHSAPELAGVKLWPARGSVSDRSRPPQLEPDKTKRVATTLAPLSAGTVFAGRLRFHNLRPVELGAVLWALSFGDATGWSSDPDVKPAKRHRLGMGKPFGLGEVSCRIGRMTFANTSTISQPVCSELVECFNKHMSAHYPGAQPWADSVQVRHLQRAANPATGRAANVVVRQRQWNDRTWEVHQLDYMEINPNDRDQRGRGGWNDFQSAKTEGYFLPRYADGNELPRQSIEAVAPPLPILPSGPFDVGAWVHDIGGDYGDGQVTGPLDPDGNLSVSFGRKVVLISKDDLRPVPRPRR